MKNAGSLRGVAGWVGAGGFLAVSLLSWVGFFLLPAALVGAAAPRRPPSAGLVCLGIASGARDYSPCPPGGSLMVPPGETSVSCGGFYPVYGIVRRVQRGPAAR